jgi:hypothetical protein
MKARLRDDIQRLLISGYGEPPPDVDDAVPAAAAGGFDDTIAIPPNRPLVESARAWPSPDALVGVMVSFIGIGEDPPGSNCNAITRWYGQGCIPWAAAAVSKACFDAGFNDGAGHWAMPGIAARTEHGFAWVADLRRAFQAAGRYDALPRRGDIAIVGGDRHACLVESVHLHGIVRTIEGDYHDDCVRNARTMASIDGFCHPPVWGVPRWPGRYLELGSQGDDVRVFQSRMAERGWRIPVDGVYGPQTQRVVDEFQHQKHLDNDGIVGPSTWEAAWRAVVT